MPPESPNPPVTPPKNSKPNVFVSPAGEMLHQDASQRPSGSTPRRGGAVDHSDQQTTQLRTQMGKVNNDNIFKSPDVWQFIEDYLPLPTTTIPASVEGLRNLGKAFAADLKLKYEDDDPPVEARGGEQQHDDTGGRPAQGNNPDTASSVPKARNWFDSETMPSDSLRTEDIYFRDYVKICNEIMQLERDHPQFHNNIRTVSHASLGSQILGSNFMIDGCFVRDAIAQKSVTVAKNLATTDVLVVLEYKKKYDLETVRDNREKVLSAVIHIMLDDLRRRFMYAISVEDRWMTLWYFSRDHCVRTTFDWWKYKATMISVFLSLMTASEEELGFDPRVHLLPLSAKRTEMAKRYIYELVPDNAGTIHYYRTENVLTDLRILHISSRITRVFEVVEVESEFDEVEYEDRPHKLLKDTWMNARSSTEGQIQKQLFDDIRKFVKSSVADQHARLPAWVKDGRLQPGVSEYLDGETNQAEKNFEKLFLIVKLESVGPPLREMNREHLWIPSRETFYPQSREAPGGAYNPNIRFASDAIPYRQRDLKTIFYTTDPQLETKLQRDYPTKKRAFMIFDDLCRPIHQLDNVGQAFEVLRDTVIALLLMYAANWVHRDISAGNVMALWNSSTKRWESRLGDFEYARVFSAQGQSNAPKSGDAYFMAAEILRGEFFIRKEALPNANPLDDDSESDVDDLPVSTDSSKSSNTWYVVHHFDHDIESIFWLGLWIVACRLGYPQHGHISKIFSPIIEGNLWKEDALSIKIDPAHVHSTSRPMVIHLEKIRNALWIAILSRNVEGQKSMDTYAFSKCHSTAFRVFDRLSKTDREWYNFALQKTPYVYFKSLVPQTEADEVFSANETTRVPKRGREEDQGDQGDEPAKRTLSSV